MSRSRAFFSIVGVDGFVNVACTALALALIGGAYFCAVGSFAGIA